MPHGTRATMLTRAMREKSSTRRLLAIRSCWPRSSLRPHCGRWARTCSTPAFPTRPAALPRTSVRSVHVEPLLQIPAAAPVALGQEDVLVAPPPALATAFCLSATTWSRAGERSSGARDLLTRLKTWGSRKCHVVLTLCSSRVHPLPIWRISLHT